MEEGEEDHVQPVFVHEGVAEQVGEVEREAEFDEWQDAFDRKVAGLFPRLRFSLDAVFRRAGELGLMAEDRFEDSAGVIDREADTEGEDHREQ